MARNKYLAALADLDTRRMPYCAYRLLVLFCHIADPTYSYLIRADNRELSKRTGFSVRSIRAGKTWLVEAGYLDKMAGRRDYYLILPDWIRWGKPRHTYEADHSPVVVPDPKVINIRSRRAH